MLNQSVASQQNLYGSEHSLANKSFDFTLLKFFRKYCLPCFQKCPRVNREDYYTGLVFSATTTTSLRLLLLHLISPGRSNINFCEIHVSHPARSWQRYQRKTVHKISCVAGDRRIPCIKHLLVPGNLTVLHLPGPGKSLCSKTP